MQKVISFQQLQKLMMIKKILFVSLFGLLSFNSLYAGTFPVTSPIPGGVAVVDLKQVHNKLTKVFFGKKRVLTRRINNQWQALIGLPLKIKGGSGSPIRAIAMVKKRKKVKKEV